ncbi:MAG: endonuclease III [Thermodesulfovibrionales bacterium]|nr:endonuclease III [Thermodesulfovibrionales bacterium]
MTDGKIKIILERLKKEYSEPKTALNFHSPFELLVATVLSAQATDILVNKVTSNLFKKYKSVQDYVNVTTEELQNDIRSINYYKTKAKNIKRVAEIILNEYKGIVPASMEELTKLPGVARKTANIILYNAFGINEGVAVDTHVKRLSVRLGLTKNNDPRKIEKDLMNIVPKEDWGIMSHLLILHGRKICQAKKPQHDNCVLRDICPSKDI